jgi:WD40 repeat protein
VNDGRIVCGGWDKTIRVWDLESGELLCTLKGHTDIVNSVHVSEGRIVSGSSDKTIRIWHLESGEPLRTLEGHTHQVNSVHASEGRIHGQRGRDHPHMGSRDGRAPAHA